MFEQLSLFESIIDDEVKCFRKNIQDAGFDYQEADIGDTTYRPGQVEPVHRWYRLTPSYSPSLVRFLIKEFQINERHFVIDPFSGRGTTSIECQKQGIKAIGIEINPLLQLVGSKSLEWDTNNLHLIEKYFAEVSSLIKEYKNLCINEVVDLLNTRVPIIYDVFRWWKEYALKDLIICREIMLKAEYSAIHKYLWIALNKACLDCANIHRNHPTISFDDKHQREINVCYEIGNNLEKIYKDLRGCLKSW